MGNCLLSPVIPADSGVMGDGSVTPPQVRFGSAVSEAEEDYGRLSKRCVRQTSKVRSPSNVWTPLFRLSDEVLQNLISYLTAL